MEQTTKQIKWLKTSEGDYRKQLKQEAKIIFNIVTGKTKKCFIYSCIYFCDFM